MKEVRLTIISGFFILLSLWLLMLVHESLFAPQNLLFSFGLGLYTVIGSMYVSSAAISHVLSTSVNGVVSVCVGMGLFGLNVLLRFYYLFNQASGILLSPVATALYLLHFPVLVFGILRLFLGYDIRDLEIWFKACLLLSGIALTSFVAAAPVETGFFDHTRFLLFFVPIGSLTVFVLVSILTAKWILGRRYFKRVLTLLFGSCMWVMGDIFMFWDILSTGFGYQDLVFSRPFAGLGFQLESLPLFAVSGLGYLLSSFFILVSLTGWEYSSKFVVAAGMDFNGPGEDTTYYREVVYKIPVGLN